jgi:hypothetical protein
LLAFLIVEQHIKEPQPKREGEETTCPNENVGTGAFSAALMRMF